MTLFLSIAVPVVLTSAALLVGFGSVVRHYRQRVLGEALMAVGGEVMLHDAMASTLGVTSKGRGQMRGNGALVVSRDEVCFVQWIPRTVLRFRRSDILRIENPKSHLGKTRGVPLLKVVFRTDGGEDSVAFHVSDLDEWMHELQSVPLLVSQPKSESESEPSRDAVRRPETVSQG